MVLTESVVGLCGAPTPAACAEALRPALCGNRIGRSWRAVKRLQLNALMGIGHDVEPCLRGHRTARHVVGRAVVIIAVPD